MGHCSANNDKLHGMYLYKTDKWMVRFDAMCCHCRQKETNVEYIFNIWIALLSLKYLILS